MLGKYIQVIMYLEYLDFGIEKIWHCCTERMFLLNFKPVPPEKQIHNLKLFSFLEFAVCNFKI